MVERTESADPSISRRLAGPGFDRKTIDGMVREDFTKLFFARLAARNLVRNEIPAAKAATTAGDAHFGGRSQIGESRSRSECAGHQGHDRDRLVCAIIGWQTCRDLTFQRRQRRWHASLLRNRVRKSTAGYDRARAISYGGWQRGLEQRRRRNLLHAFPPEGGATRNGSE